MRPATLLKAAILLSGVALAYRKFVRPGVINWGATEAEAQSALPGDDILSDVNLQTTRAVTIDAPPEHRHRERQPYSAGVPAPGTGPVLCPG